MALCAISFTALDASETAVEGVVLEAYLPQNVEDGNNLLVQRRVVATTDSAGSATLNLQQGLEDVLVRVITPNGAAGTNSRDYTITVPAAASAEFNTLI